MSKLNTIQMYENQLHDNLSSADFYSIARALENLTEEWVQDTKPLDKPAKETIYRNGELTVANGKLQFNLYPAIDYNTTTQNNF